MRKTIKSLWAVGLAAAMVITSLPTSGLTTVKAEESDATPSNIGEERTLDSGFVTKDNGEMRDGMDSAAYMKEMGLGWNYGNSLEQSIDTSSMTEEELASMTVNKCETSAGNSALTQKNVDALKSYGFNNIRIPVAWSNLMDISEDGMTYTVNEGYLQRVEEVINYCLNDGLYAIVNIHYDGDWWGQFGDEDESVRQQAWARYEQIWTQVCERYKDYSDRLIFESANEELGDRLNDDWRKRSTENKTGVLTVDEQYDTLNQINQKFVDIVRASGGNNEKRYLLIAGYSTNIERTCDERFKMPTDPVEGNGNSKLSVSVHYYTPWNYCGGSEYHQSEGMAARLYDWGTDDDIAELHSQMDMMSKFTEQGYGVIIGEYGVQTTAADGIPTYLQTVAEYAIEKGMVPVLWDNGGWFDRGKNRIAYDDVTQAILNVTGKENTFRSTRVNTGKPLYTEVTSEENLTPLYTWEGRWKKNGGGNLTFFESVNGSAYYGTDEAGNVTRTVNENDGIDGTVLSVKSNDGENDWVFHCNSWGYWSVIYSEALKDVEHLCIRVTCEDGDTDTSTLQVAVADFKSSNPVSGSGLYMENEADSWCDNNVTNTGAMENCKNGKETDIAAEEDWNGRIFSIDEDLLQGSSLLWISASNKPIITKIELFSSSDPLPTPKPSATAKATATAETTPEATAIAEATNAAQPSATAAVTAVPVQSTPTPSAIAAAPTSSAPAKGDVVKKGGSSYTVTNAEKKTVAYTGSTSKKVTSVTVPATVKVDGVSYKVTSIAKKAFKGQKKLKKVIIGKNVTQIGASAYAGCSNLKKIDIQTTKLASVGKNAFKGIHKKAVFTVPKAKLKAYKKLLKAKTGVTKTMKIRKA